MSIPSSRASPPSTGWESGVRPVSAFRPPQVDPTVTLPSRSTTWRWMPFRRSTARRGRRRHGGRCSSRVCDSGPPPRALLTASPVGHAADLALGHSQHFRCRDPPALSDAPLPTPRAEPYDWRLTERCPHPPRFPGIGASRRRLGQADRRSRHLSTHQAARRPPRRHPQHSRDRTGITVWRLGLGLHTETIRLRDGTCPRRTDGRLSTQGPECSRAPFVPPPRFAVPPSAGPTGKCSFARTAQARSLAETGPGHRSARSQRPNRRHC